MKKLRVLIVESDIDVTKSIRQTVEQVRPESTFETARSHMTVQGFLDPKDPFDIIFWGGDISGGDTLGLIAMARQMFPKCPMVATGTTLMDKQLEAGCDYSVVKPDMNIRELLAEIFPEQ